MGVASAIGGGGGCFDHGLGILILDHGLGILILDSRADPSLYRRNRPCSNLLAAFFRVFFFTLFPDTSRADIFTLSGPFW